MDLDYLYKRHQVSLFMLVDAAGIESRRVHRELPHVSASRIAVAKGDLPTFGAA